MSVIWCLLGHLARQWCFCLVVLEIDKQTASCHSLSLTFLKYPLLPLVLHLFICLSFSLSSLIHRFVSSTASLNTLICVPLLYSKTGFFGVSTLYPSVHPFVILFLMMNYSRNIFFSSFHEGHLFRKFQSFQISLVPFLSIVSNYGGHVVLGCSINVTYLRDRSSLGPACGSPEQAQIAI